MVMINKSVPALEKDPMKMRPDSTVLATSIVEGFWLQLQFELEEAANSGVADKTEPSSISQLKKLISQCIDAERMIADIRVTAMRARAGTIASEWMGSDQLIMNIGKQTSKNAAEAAIRIAMSEARHVADVINNLEINTPVMIVSEDETKLFPMDTPKEEDVKQ